MLEESGVDRALIGQAMLGTTQCTNAIVERKGLSPIAVLRIGAPASVGIPPMVDWADDIAAVCVDSAIIEGGFEYDGKRLAEFDEAACPRVLRRRARQGGTPWPSSCVFSTVRDDDELRAAGISARGAGRGRSRVRLERDRIDGPRRARERHHPERGAPTAWRAASPRASRRAWPTRAWRTPRLYLSQNDGTLMTDGARAAIPVLTIRVRADELHPRRELPVASATTPSSSTWAARPPTWAFLSRGFPRESGVAATIGGRCARASACPTWRASGLGGGSVVRVADDGRRERGARLGGLRDHEAGARVRRRHAHRHRRGRAPRRGRGGGRIARGRRPRGTWPSARWPRSASWWRTPVDAMKVSSDPVDAVQRGRRRHRAAARSCRHGPAWSAPSTRAARTPSAAPSRRVSGALRGACDYDVTPRDEALAAARAAAVEAARGGGRGARDRGGRRRGGRAASVLPRPHEPREGEGCGGFVKLIGGFLWILFVGRSCVRAAARRGGLSFPRTRCTGWAWR